MECHIFGHFKSHKVESHFSRMGNEMIHSNLLELMAYENIYILSVLKFHSPRTHVCHHTETPILPVLNFTRSKSWNRHWFHRASTKGSAFVGSDDWYVEGEKNGSSTSLAA